MPARCRRTMEPREAAGPHGAGSLGPRPGYHRGYSLLPSAICLIPSVEGLLWRVRHLAVPAPGIEAVVDHPPRQMGERHIGGGDRGAIGGGPRQQFAGRLHLDPLSQRRLVALDEHPPPRIDLLVNVDLDRADIAAAAV